MPSLNLENFIVSNNMLPGLSAMLIFCSSRYGRDWKAFMAETDTGSGLRRFPHWCRCFLTWMLPCVIVAPWNNGWVDKCF